MSKIVFKRGAGEDIESDSVDDITVSEDEGEETFVDRKLTFLSEARQRGPGTNLRYCCWFREWGKGGGWQLLCDPPNAVFVELPTESCTLWLKAFHVCLEF